jgi:DNA-binding FadR family transcriptional regulator
MKSFPRVERRRLSETVAGQLEEAILSGDFQTGHRLPAEQALADQFGVSRNVVREAFKMLQERGLIEVLNGSGAYVARPNTLATSNALARYLRLLGANSSVKALYEVRKIIEGSNARLAAERADADDLARMAVCLDQMQSNMDSIERWSAADLDFHQAVAQATHNPFLSAILQPLVEQLRGMIAEGYLVPGAVQTGLEAHQRLYGCIAEHDPEAALQAMLDHLQDSEMRVETVLAPA